MISDKTEMNLLYHNSTHISRIYNVIINSADRPDSRGREGGGGGLGFYLKNILVLNMQEKNQKRLMSGTKKIIWSQK